LLGASFVALLCAVLVPRPLRRPFAAVVAALGFLGGMGTAIALYVQSEQGERVIANAFYRDRWMALSTVIVCAVGLLTVGASYRHVPRERAVPVGAPPPDDHVSEYYALLLAAGAGMAFFVGAANLMTLFLSLEWFSLCLYVMCAIDYDLEGSLEA